MAYYQKSIVSAVCVMASVGAVLLGNSWRSRVDRALIPSQTDNLLASIHVTGAGNEAVADQDFVREMASLLKREYVDPITDDGKLASGAVRGMVGSLNDADSHYYDKSLFPVVMNERVGKFEGIGAAFTLRASKPDQDLSDSEEDDSTPPEDAATGASQLVVTSVIPGGPADRAGIKPGDVVNYVDSRWLPELSAITTLRKAQSDFDKNVINRDQYVAIHKALRKEIESAISPMKAMAKLVEGTSGAVEVVWTRDGKTHTTKLAKEKSELPFSASAGEIRLPTFGGGASESLKAAIQNKRAVTLDLRGNGVSDFEDMRKCLAVLAPPGDYGYIATFKGSRARAIHVSSGNSHPPTSLKILVDSSTVGSAEAFALALRDRLHAKIVGPPMSPDRNLVQYYALPDGSGYSLVIGRYSTKRPKLTASTSLRFRVAARSSEPEAYFG